MINDGLLNSEGTSLNFQHPDESKKSDQKTEAQFHPSSYEYSNKPTGEAHITDKNEKTDVAAKGTTRKSIKSTDYIFQAYINVLTTKLKDIDEKGFTHKKVGSIVFVTEKYSKSLTRSPQERLFLSTLLMIFRNNFMKLEKININDFIYEINSFSSNELNKKSLDEFLVRIYKLGLSPLKSGDNEAKE